jgi:hypothetical protein
MSKKLNRITDEMAQRDIQKLPESLAIRAAKPYGDLPTDERERHAYHVGRMYTKMALHKYQLDYPVQEVVQDFVQGAHWRAERVNVLVSGRLAEKSPWPLFLRDVGLVTAFGTDVDRAQLAPLPSEQITGTDELEEPGCKVARLWKDSLGSGTVAREALAEEIRRCEADNADRWDREWTHGIARCLLAVRDGSQSELKAGLEEITKFTEREAWRGDWQRLPEGQISLVGLGLCRLAQSRGLPTQVDSVYIPLPLLQEGK